MQEETDRFMDRARDEAGRLMALADEGEHMSQDDGCMVVCSVIRDCAYKIRREVDRETRAHVSRRAYARATGGNGK